MKKLLLSFSVCSLVALGACKENTGNAANADGEKYKMMNSEIFKGIETGDMTKAKEYIADDAIDHNANPATMADVVGKDSIIAMMSSMSQCFKLGYKFNIISQAVDGDYLFCLSEMKGTTVENPKMGMPGNKEFNMKGVDVSKMKNGKFSEHWTFMTMKDMMEMMPAPGAPAMPVPADSTKPAM